MKNPKIGKLLSGFSTLKEMKENPLGFFFDLLLAAIISAFMPIPFVGAVVTRYKTQIIWAIVSFVLLGMFCLIAAFSLFFSTLSLSLRNSMLPVGLQGSTLEGYIEDGFTNTDIPQRNPLGGNGFTNAIITFDYHQAGYGFFDGVHEGIDLYPSQTYFRTNKAYLKTGQIIVFATLNGTGDYYVDQYGSNTVEIVNTEGTLKTINMHLAVSFISTGQPVIAGEPIGIMGATGEATGVHLHYQIDLNDSGIWTPTDPKQYIQ